MKNWQKLIFSISLLIVGVILAGLLSRLGPERKLVQLPNGQRVIAEVVNTPTKREKGLSGRPSLASSSGMLFVFETPGKKCFWMKGMRFNLDIAWFNSAKQLVYLVKDISPDSYPQTFCSDEPALYVLEVNAGEADKIGLQEGSQVSF